MITRSLIEFIQREQAAGTAKDGILAILGDKGWKHEDISAAFAFLTENDRSVPTPPRTKIFTECCEILSLVWSVYCSRWKRFVGLGAFYLVSLLLLQAALYMWITPVLSAFFGFMMRGDVASALFYAAPYLSVGVLGYVLFQLWYVATLYSTALKKGDSLLERARTGLIHLPAVLGIKVAIALLLMITSVPVLATTVITDNPLVLVVFGPLFLLGTLLLWFLLSLSLPAYFHGVSWRAAGLRSIMIASKNIVPLLSFYLCFGALLVLVFLVLRENPFITVPIAIGVIAPIQSLLQLALYRRFAPSEAETLPETPVDTVKTEKKVRRGAKSSAA